MDSVLWSGYRERSWAVMGGLRRAASDCALVMARPGREVRDRWTRDDGDERSMADEGSVGQGVQCRRLWDFAMCTSVTAADFRLSADLSVSKPGGFRIVPRDTWKKVPSTLKRSTAGGEIQSSSARVRERPSRPTLPWLAWLGWDLATGNSGGGTSGRTVGLVRPLQAKLLSLAPYLVPSAPRSYEINHRPRPQDTVIAALSVSLACPSSNNNPHSLLLFSSLLVPSTSISTLPPSGPAGLIN